MSNGPDWGKCVETGQAKAIGVPWSDEEMHARYELHIPADFVRNGVLTLEQYEQAKKGLESGETGSSIPPHRYWKKEQLVQEAKAKGLQFDEHAVTRNDLFLMLES